MSPETNIDSIKNEAHLEDLLSSPTETAVRALGQLEGDILLLGAGGKMGPTLSRMAKRASDVAGTTRRIYAVSRFSEPGVEPSLKAHGVETIRGDLFDDSFLESLPEVANVLYMVGMKFGTGLNAGRTWAANVYLPARAIQRFGKSRIVAFSTGNVYPLVPIASGGSKESEPLTPLGEYAMTALGRERMFEYFGRSLAIPVVLLRLNYAVEMRYGVLVDIARKVLAEEPIDLAMGYANVIWQGDANAMALCAFAHTSVPPSPINVAGPELVRVRDVAERFGEIWGKPVRFEGHEAKDALLSNGQHGYTLLDRPRVTIDQVILWTANWLQRGERTLDKPTHFEARDGMF